MRVTRHNSKNEYRGTFVRRMNILKFRDIRSNRALRKEMQAIRRYRRSVTRDVPIKVEMIKWRFTNAIG